MYYYIYKITNKINGNFYIGRRQSCVDPVLDEYFGSGKILKLAISKYGKENFVKEIVSEFNSLEELIEAEKEAITKELTERNDCYNISLGGHGGYTYYAERKFSHTEETKKKISIANSGRPRPDLRERTKDFNWKDFWSNKTRTEEDRKAKSISAAKSFSEGKHPATKILTCPHCSLSTGMGNAKRWHFDNCKKRNNEQH